LAFEFSVTSARAFDRAHAEVSVEPSSPKSVESCQGLSAENFNILRAFEHLRQFHPY
jgi:hypothetical protein